MRALSTFAASVDTASFDHARAAVSSNGRVPNERTKYSAGGSAGSGKQSRMRASTVAPSVRPWPRKYSPSPDVTSSPGAAGAPSGTNVRADS
jgi:hypothetical protein